jgi:hypothetical protein
VARATPTIRGVGVWSRVQRTLWTGAIVKDYGAIGDRQFGRARRTLSVVLSEKNGGRLIIKESYRGVVAFSLNFVELDADEAVRLAEAIQDALPRLRAGSPPVDQ